MVCIFHKYGKISIEIVGSEDISSGKKLRAVCATVHGSPDALYIFSDLVLIAISLFSPYQDEETRHQKIS